MTWTQLAQDRAERMTTTTFETRVEGGKLVRIQTVYRASGLTSQVAEALTFVPDIEKPVSRKRKPTDKDA